MNPEDEVLEINEYVKTAHIKLCMLNLVDEKTDGGMDVNTYCKLRLEVLNNLSETLFQRFGYDSEQ